MRSGARPIGGWRWAGAWACRPALVATAVVLLLAPPVAAQRWAIDDPGQGPVALEPGLPGARELSGLSWAGGDRYASVSDKDGRLYWLRIAIDPAAARITGAIVEGSLPLANSSDLEGVALAPDGKSVAVSDEVGPAVREYRLPDGQLERTAPLPPVFASLRYNLGLEALTRDQSGQFWTGNEEALKVDGPTSTAEQGTLVRLLRLDGDLRPTGQWAYRTDPVAGAQMLSDHGTGLSELAALPDGRLLALERSFGSEGLRIRIYEVEIDGATEVSKLPALADAEVVPAPKQLLWQRTSLRDNFEGMAIGPPLADGSRSLVLVSDDGHALAQALYPLRLRQVASPRPN
ncbi:MAG TPA: esterase-like activity of phytase family protein [Candidatus Dormibacteraeota bacterium]|nr:esterase-like activity of phytase family protein [Candidatus Dormibacteraeota bacterium]